MTSAAFSSQFQSKHPPSDWHLIWMSWRLMASGRLPGDFWPRVPGFVPPGSDAQPSYDQVSDFEEESQVEGLEDVGSNDEVAMKKPAAKKDLDAKPTKKPAKKPSAKTTKNDDHGGKKKDGKKRKGEDKEEGDDSTKKKGDAKQNGKVPEGKIQAKMPRTQRTKTRTRMPMTTRRAMQRRRRRAAMVPMTRRKARLLIRRRRRRTRMPRPRSRRQAALRRSERQWSQRIGTLGTQDAANADGVPRAVLRADRLRSRELVVLALERPVDLSHLSTWWVSVLTLERPGCCL